MDRDKVEAWFERRRFTLDLAGLTEQERKEGSILLGGSAASFVMPGENFEYSEVNTVLFRWGDPIAADTFANMLEHDDNPDSSYYFPFSATTVVGDNLWTLAVQAREFMPALAYSDDRHYIEMPFDEEKGSLEIQRWMTLPTPRPQLIGKVGPRWVLFGMGMQIKD